MKMTVPWADVADHRPDTAIVQVSRLELRRFRDVPGFLRAAMRLRKDVLATDGAIGVSLVAEPFRRTFWTLSAWSDQQAVAAFTRSDRHRAVMQRYRDRMRGSHFHTWEETTADRLPPVWADARARLDA